MKNFDIIIIGAGPNGLSAASYLSKSGKKVLVVEKNEEVGGLAQYADSSSSLSKKVIDQLGLKINTKKKRTFVTSLNDSFNHTVLEIDENKPIILICRSGKRSKIIAQMMNENFDHDIYNAKRGIISWIDEKLITVEPQIN